MQDKPWQLAVVIGAVILTVYPVLDQPYYAIGAGFAIGLLMVGIIRLCRRINSYLQTIDRLPGVMTVRAYSLSVLLSFAYIAWNLGVLFPMPAGSGASYVGVGLLYGGLLSILVAGGKTVAKRLFASRIVSAS